MNKQRILNRLFLLFMGLAIALHLAAMLLANLIVAVLAMAFGFTAFIIQFWLGCILYDIPRGGEDDFSKEFPFLPGHPDNTTVYTKATPSIRIRFAMWLMATALYIAISKLSNLKFILPCCFFFFPLLFTFGVAVPWYNNRVWSKLNDFDELEREPDDN